MKAKAIRSSTYIRGWDIGSPPTNHTALWVLSVFPGSNLIVRPGRLTIGSRVGQYRAITDLNGIHGGKIARADVADFMLSQAKSPEFIGKTPLLIY